MSKIDYILEVKNLEKKYELSSETLVVFSGLNLCVKEGEKCVIIGRSGSGKSTLLNIIGGLDSSSSGDVLIDGNNLNLMKEKDLAEFRKNDLGFVFQFHHLLKDFTALENVFLPAIMAGHSKKTAENRKKVLTDAGAKVMEEKEMGQRELAYEINKFNTGYYFLFVVEADSKSEQEFNRVARINESLLRHIVVRVEDK